MNHRATQRNRIFALLMDEWGKHLNEQMFPCGRWVPLPEILALGISQYGARVLELRRMGHVIENRSEWEGRVRHSWFRIVGTPDEGSL